MHALDEAKRMNLLGRARQLGCLTADGLTTDEQNVMDYLVMSGLFTRRGGNGQVVSFRPTADAALYLDTES